MLSPKTARISPRLAKHYNKQQDKPMNDSLDPILQQEEQRKLRVQLIWRLVIAVILVAGVLATLTWLDRDRETTPKMTVNTPQTNLAASQTASAPSFEPALTQQASIEANPTASSTEAEIPNTPAAWPASSPSPGVVNPGSSPIAPTSPTTIQPLSNSISKPEDPASPPIPRKSNLPTHETISPASARQASISTPPLLQQAHTETPYPSPVAATHGYTVQTGVFLHSANAEKMLKQVQYAGIPAYLETRVQIGPFRSRVEANAAVRKLRSLGIEPIIKIE